MLCTAERCPMKKLGHEPKKCSLSNCQYRTKPIIKVSAVSEIDDTAEPNMRDKLIALTKNALAAFGSGADRPCTAEEFIADFLLSNFCTIQEWMPISTPPKKNTPVLVSYIAYGTDNETEEGIACLKSWGWVWWEGGLEDSCEEVTVEITHWMPLPKTHKDSALKSFVEKYKIAWQDNYTEEDWITHYFRADKSLLGDKIKDYPGVDCCLIRIEQALIDNGDAINMPVQIAPAKLHSKVPLAMDWLDFDISKSDVNAILGCLPKK